MSTDIDFKMLQVQAGADLSGEGSKFKAITIGGTIAAGPNLAAGILRHGAQQGANVSLAYHGVTKVLAGAAVSTVGFPLKVTTSGWIIAAASGDVSIGRALATAASGDLVQAFVDFVSLGYWHG
jgi:hypothetical protein